MLAVLAPAADDEVLALLRVEILRLARCLPESQCRVIATSGLTGRALEVATAACDEAYACRFEP